MTNNLASGDYFDAVREADEALDDALGHVRAREDDREITTAEAAEERVGLMERHLALCQSLRRKYFGEPQGSHDLG